MPGEEQRRNGLASAPHDTLVTELAKAESDLERIEAQRTAANARIAALRNELAALDTTPRRVAPEPLSELAPRTPADKVKLFRQLVRGRPDLYPTRFVSKKTGKPGYAPACSNKFVPGVCELPKVKCGDCTRQAFKQVDDAIGVHVGKIVNQYKVGKHFALSIGDAAFSFQRKHDSIAAEAALDGLYLIRTSVPAAQMDAPDCVRNYKALANIERAFRSLKTVDLKVRPIHHHLADRVRAHIFLCLLAYYVEWHLREAWRELLFADTDQERKAARDPVAPAKRSTAALAKVASKHLADGTPAHSFCTLLAELATIVRNTCRTPSAGNDAPTFDVTTTSNLKQKRALELLQQIQL